MREKKSTVREFVYLTIALIPITLFSYIQYINQRNAELEYVGVYYLTEYPNCDTCVLNLNSDNAYTVIFDDRTLEQGKWKYSSGGDYWIVDIGKNGQLGSGKYKYNDRKNNFKE
ncbi:hypothetical protein SAMN05421823_102769 [Catalinimonas alkaloidigena]|uniref:Uncharacterized protein n=2 Tax=Catalinimonas alkaloidigena TaxID=1075417 RepID=A0A1G9C1I1_9BACT|nr:hypothetical protein SAMN05421823_102769 [Catalinimonas alkaloidigena]